MRTLAIDDLLGRFYGGNQERPFKVFLELTHRCNFNCRHCYLPRLEYSRPLRLADYRSIAGELESMGVLHVILTGGEPLLHPDFSAVYRLFKERGFWVTVMTNGHDLDNRHFDLFESLPPKAVEISLYSMEQASFSEFTGTALDFNRVIENILRLTTGQVPLYLKTVLTRDNRAQFQAIKEFAVRHGLPFRYETRFHPDINGCVKCPDKQVPVDAIKEIDSRNTPLLDEIRLKHQKRVQAARSSRIGGRGRFRCGIGLKSFVVDPSGFVHGCLLYRAHRWNLLDTPLPVIFKEYLPRLRNEKRDRPIACDSCDSANECSFCEGVLWLSHNDPAVISEYCAITRNRQELALKRL